jgi:hypothetical protein
MSVPLIFIHRTEDNYIEYVLKQAKRANPKSAVFLIGSESNRKFISAGMQHFLIRDYFEGASQFAKIYKHVSHLEYEYLLFCFQRWFVLRDFMLKQNINECWVIDTDVMVFADLDEPRFDNFSFEKNWNSKIPLSKIKDFCKLQMDYFSNDSSFELLKTYAIHRGHQRNNEPLISDMVTMNLYYENYLKEKRTNGVFADSFFDTNLFVSSPGVEMLGKRKKIYLIDNTLYCKKLISNEFIKVNSIHFTAPQNKKFIKYFFLHDLDTFYKSGSYYFNYETKSWIKTP